MRVACANYIDGSAQFAWWSISGLLAGIIHCLEQQHGQQAQEVKHQGRLRWDAYICLLFVIVYLLLLCYNTVYFAWPYNIVSPKVSCLAMRDSDSVGVQYT